MSGSFVRIYKLLVTACDCRYNRGFSRGFGRTLQKDSDRGLLSGGLMSCAPFTYLAWRPVINKSRTVARKPLEAVKTSICKVGVTGFAGEYVVSNEIGAVVDNASFLFRSL